ncbi:hypothetical protein [Deinococcus misasensis]|uniref:hypothetical protein n=1 Tax=Deinococcus misasensis TaxID=392413 RepID=UPI00054FBB3F|nr:hypothetical protein [Deinococcus misasensis]
MSTEPLNPLQMMDLKNRAYIAGGPALKYRTEIGDLLWIQKALDDLSASLPRIPADRPADQQLVANIIKKLQQAIQKTHENLAKERQAQSKPSGLFGA